MNEQLSKLMAQCDYLKAITSTINKKRMLSAMLADGDFYTFLKFLLDPRVVTGIRKAKLLKNVGGIPKVILHADFKWLLHYLEEHNTGTAEDILVCQSWMNTYTANEEEREFCVGTITKKIRIGVDAKTANAACGNNFIYLHEVQQGSPRDKLRLKDGETFYLSQKMNGIRATYVDGKLISRQGVEFSGLDHIIKDIHLLEEYDYNDFVFDGELIRKNTDGVSDNENFRLTAGIVNGNGDKSDIEFVLFDMLPLEEFKAGQSSYTYAVRRDDLIDVSWRSDIQSIRVVPMVYAGNDPKMVDVCLAEADANGYEGLMLNKDVPYYCKRHTGLVKIKTFHFSDLRILRCEEGEGRLAGTLGALIVDYNGNEVGVGTGFSDAQRGEFWARRDALPGMIAEIKYKEVSKDKKTGLESIQFPVFVQIREDKTEPSLG